MRKNDLFLLLVLYFTSFYLAIKIIPFLILILSIEKIIILVLIFLIVYFFISKDKKNLPTLLLLLFCFHLGFLPIQNNLTKPVLTLDDVASIIIHKTGNDYNHTYWVQRDPILRLTLHYYLPAGLPSNDQNYVSLYPLTLNQTEGLDQFQQSPQFFIVDLTTLQNLQLFGTINWLKNKFSSNHVSLGSFSSNQSEWFFFY